MAKRFQLWVVGNTEGYIWPQVYWERPEGIDGRENPLQPDTRVYCLTSEPIEVDKLTGYYTPIEVAPPTVTRERWTKPKPGDTLEGPVPGAVKLTWDTDSTVQAGQPTKPPGDQL